MKKLFVTLLTPMTVLLLMTGCGVSNETADTSEEKDTAVEVEAEEAKDEQVNVHILMNDTKDYQASIKSYYEKWAEDNADAVEMVMYDAEDDMNTQVSQCDMALTKGADAIIIVPVDSTTCDSITEMCEDAEVPLVCGQNPADSGYDVWVGSDHTLAGKLEGEYIAEKLGGKGNVAIIYGGLGNDATNKRWEGAKEVLEEYEDINIVAESTGNWLRDEGMSLMENWLQSDNGADLSAVIGGNDEMTIGAVLAAVDAERTDIVFAGVDASQEALEYVAGDTVDYCTILQDGENICKAAGDWALKLARGEKVEKETYVEIPYVKITKDNVDEYLK